MKTLSLVLVPGVLLLAAGAASAGVTIHVPQDFPTVQEAIDSAVETDIIMISNGQYRENLVVATPGITLKGTGKDVFIDGAYLGSCLEVTADDVTIMGIIFANGGPPVDGGGTGGGTEGTETGSGGVLITGAGALVTKCEFRANVDFGLKLVGTGEVVDNLIVATLVGPGLVLDSGDSAGPLTTVKSNEIVRNASGVEALKGPFLFDKNTIGNNTGDGLSVSILTADGAGPGSDPTQITKNKLFGNGATALLLVDELGSTTLIDKNNIDENGTGMNLTADGITVSKNDIDQSLLVGAWLQVSNMTWDSNKMRRSTIAGAVISTAPGVTDGNNTFTDSHFQTSGGDGAIVQSSLNVFDDCLFSDNQGDGFSIVGGVAGNQVLKSMSRDNGHDGYDNSGTDTLFTDNKSKNNLGADLAGIGDGTGTVDAASAGNTVSDESGLEAEQELELDTLATLP